MAYLFVNIILLFCISMWSGAIVNGLHIVHNGKVLYKDYTSYQLGCKIPILYLSKKYLDKARVYIS